MVDAITSYNANKPVNPKKDYTINWNMLTVDEIKEYDNAGVEVPEYIKKWAEYIEHLDNVPDDVTYISYAQDHKIIDNSIISKLPFESNKVVEFATEKGIYEGLCQDTIGSIKNKAKQLDMIMNLAEKEVGEAEISKDGLIDRIQTLQQRAAALKNNKKDPLAPMEIIDINNQIKAYGENGVNVMDMRLIALQNIGGDVGEAYELIKGANSLAQTVVDQASRDLLSRAKFNSYSKQLKELSKEHKRDFKSASDEQEQYVDTVGGYKNDVGSSANQFIPPGSEVETSSLDGTGNNSNNGNNGNNDILNNDKKAQKSKTTEKSKAEKSKTLADEKILTDPNEILKRKQKRGEA